jgi:type I restriction enzyme, S subunit
VHIEKLTFDLNDWLKRKVKLPPLPEQKKIASILTSVDEVIENTSRQIDKLQDLKKATMNELLTKGIGHTEFKDSELGRIPKSWDVVIGNDVLKLGGGASPSTITFCSDGDVLFMKVDDFNNPENYDEIASTSLSFLKESNKRIKIYPKGTVVIAKRGAAILKNRVKLFSRETTVDSNLMTIEVSRYHPKFFLYYLQWEDLSSLADTTSIPQLNNFHLYEHYFPMPPYKEQLKILETIFSIDKKTQTHRQKLSQTQSLKKSLMQDLLTGKVRVTVN